MELMIFLDIWHKAVMWFVTVPTVVSTLFALLLVWESRIPKVKR